MAWRGRKRYDGYVLGRTDCPRQGKTGCGKSDSSLVDSVTPVDNIGEYTKVGCFDYTEEFKAAVENNPVLEGWEIRLS